MKVLLGLLAFPALAFAIGQPRYVEDAHHAGSFPIVHAPIFVDSADYPGVARAARDLQADIARVTGQTPRVLTRQEDLGAHPIIVGTIGKSHLIDEWIRNGKLTAAIAGKWETFVIQVVRAPAPGITSALVIAGSDERGAIYGVYDLSEQIGVSPWYWWADVPVAHKDGLFVKAGSYTDGPPAVKYRGIFLNDEAPALTGWVKEHYGNYNHQFYEKVFELLRMKGNFLWPAMWNSAFNEDDPLNPKLADEYGVVMGTSHHEPMLRAQQEWKRHGQGPWDYAKNGEFLRSFWAEGIARNKNYESIVTIGMRGDGDRPMAPTVDAGLALLEQVVADQRKILPAGAPQLWALYKEVQSYYEKGMRVPDDVTLLWSDDNWGNLRRLPMEEERGRSGGAGIYYHFDYVGGPRNYKWINTNSIVKVQEQMNLAYAYGADRIWIVNVGDLKPMEFPSEFFLHLAWNPKRWNKDHVAEYTRLWAEREFGRAHAADIADITTKYSEYVSRRKPELLGPFTFSWVNYGEADRVLAEYKALAERAANISQALPEPARDAFFELVQHPVLAAGIVTELYMTVARNHLYADQGRASTNDFAAAARQLFQDDASLSAYYNHTLAGGKWNHMMDQTHIGYTMWQEPPANKMPEVREIIVPQAAEMGIAVDEPLTFDVYRQPTRYIDVYNRGREPFEFTVKTSAPWIVCKGGGKVEKEQRVTVSVDWQKAPAERTQGYVEINTQRIPVEAFNPATPPRDSLTGFVETDGYICIDPEHYTRKLDTDEEIWDRLPGYGMTTFPPRSSSGSPALEYKMYLFDTGKADVETSVAPTQNFVPGRGLRFGISLDDNAPQVVDTLEHNSPADWATSVKDSVRKVHTTLTVAAPGYHTLKIWMVDPNVVLRKIVVNMGGVKPSYLGPPESYRK